MKVQAGYKVLNQKLPVKAYLKKLNACSKWQMTSIFFILFIDSNFLLLKLLFSKLKQKKSQPVSLLANSYDNTNLN